MKKFKKHKFTLFMASTALIFYGAVFLKIILPSLAQTTTYNFSTSTYQAPTYNTIDQTRTETYTAPNSATSGQTTTQSSTTSTYTVPTNTASTNTATDTIIWPNSTSTDTLTHYILTLNFTSQPSTVYGKQMFYVQTSEPAEVAFSVYKDSSTLLSRNPGVTRSDNTYSFEWDTNLIANGQYFIEAYAKKSGYVDASKKISVMVQNPANQNSVITPTTINPSPAIPATYTTTPPTYTPVTTINTAGITNSITAIKSYEVNFTENFQSPVSGIKRIAIASNFDINEANFFIEGPLNSTAFAARETMRSYYFDWQTGNFPNGNYKITVNARVNGDLKASRSINITIYNQNPNQQIQPGLSTASSTTQITTQYNPNQPQKTIKLAQSPEILPDCLKNNIISVAECAKYMSLPSECKKKNIINSEDCNKYLSMPSKCRDKGISNKSECDKYLYQLSMPTECKKVNAKSQEECNNIIFSSSLPAVCKKLRAVTKEECDKIIAVEAYLTPECKEANIYDLNTCEKYMSSNFMPQECRKAGATTQAECDLILRNKAATLKNVEANQVELVKQTGNDLSSECKELGATTQAECEKKIFLKSAPDDCRIENITNSADCQKYLFSKNAPEECLNAGVTTAEECEKITFEKSAPEECRVANITNAEACKKYMFDKYSKDERIAIQNFPIECQKAGALTDTDCDKIMKLAYMPKLCTDNGISGEKECEVYLQIKNMSQECRDAQVKTQADCDKIMFKKYGPKECVAAGIEGEEQCKNFMFNKYSQTVECNGISSWQCKSSVKENHLGNIVAKQTQYTEIENKIAPLAGTSISSQDLKNTVSTPEMIPVKESSSSFVVINTEKKVVLDQEENLIQTAPVALMLDNDADGLPNDLEKRMGTDPNKADSDGDGYNDGLEVKNNYNPLGPGQSEKSLAPIEQAIIENKTIEQPKTNGTISAKLAVSTITNTENKDKGVTIKGKADPNSILSIYVYSDLPLLATVKADEYGNWEYELSESLVDGEHEVYVALNDNTGKIISKSEPTNFFIKEAKATSLNDYIADTIQASSQPSKADNLVKYYLIFSGVIIFVGILLFVMFIKQQKTRV